MTSRPSGPPPAPLAIGHPKYSLVKRRRLNLISHLLSRIPYQDLTAKKLTLPNRKVGPYKTADYPFKVIPQVFSRRET